MTTDPLITEIEKMINEEYDEWKATKNPECHHATVVLRQTRQLVIADRERMVTIYHTNEKQFPFGLEIRLGDEQFLGNQLYRTREEADTARISIIQGKQEEVSK